MLFSGRRCCFPSTKLYISGVFGYFSKIPGGLSTGFHLFVSLCLKHHVCVTPRLHLLLTFVCSSALQAGGGTLERKLVSYEYGINYLYVFFNSTGKIQSALKTRLQENMFFPSFSHLCIDASEEKKNKSCVGASEKYWTNAKAYNPFMPWRAENGGCHSESLRDQSTWNPHTSLTS